MQITGATWGNWFWAIWLGFVALSFLGVEFYALATNVHNTLSWFAWTRDVNYSAGWYLSLGFYLTTASWLVYHIWFRRFT